MCLSSHISSQDEQTSVAKAFPHLKIFKKSVLLKLFGYERRLSIPKDAVSLLAGAKKLDLCKGALEDKFNELGKLKKKLGKCSFEFIFSYCFFSYRWSLHVLPSIVAFNNVCKAEKMQCSCIPRHMAHDMRPVHIKDTDSGQN